MSADRLPVSDVWFEIVLASGETLRAPIQGSGGRVGSGASHLGPDGMAITAQATIERAQRRAARGTDSGLYEPEPGHVAAFPEQGAESDGPRRVVPLVGTVFRATVPASIPRPA